MELVCDELDPALELLRGVGMRLDVIYPADDPHTALLSKDGAVVRLTARPGEAPPRDLPEFHPEFVLTRASQSAGKGRAGMLYRDLIPSRLGGRCIASHIRIADGGPVGDWVHFHRIAFQAIYVRSGCVRVVYEDQGDPFVMNAGDLVLQPPLIRHRVLESSSGVEVVEITCPALHETFADHDMQLPNGLDEGRRFGDQHFLWHRAEEAVWTPFLAAEAQESGIHEATGGIAQVRTVRAAATPTLSVPPHDGELVFGFVLDGTARLEFDGSMEVGPADSFVIPPHQGWALAQMSPDLRLLHVTTSHLG